MVSHFTLCLGLLYQFAFVISSNFSQLTFLSNFFILTYLIFGDQDLKIEIHVLYTNDKSGDI